MTTLPFRSPYNFAALLAFLGPRAVSGLEVVTASAYQRTQPGFSVEVTGGKRALSARIEAEDAAAVAGKLRRCFDLDADSRKIDAHLAKSPLLAPLVAAHPGIRIPGCWDGFELAVRAILGQQVTVKGATTLMNRLVTRWGVPNAAKLADAPVEEIGLPLKRAETIRVVARAVAGGTLSLDGTVSACESIERMCALPGLGPWTAHYIAMRAVHAEDAFPASDLGLMKAAGVSTPKQLERLAEPWRPYRAYAAFYLWRGLG